LLINDKKGVTRFEFPSGRQAVFPRIATPLPFDASKMKLDDGKYSIKIALSGYDGENREFRYTLIKKHDDYNIRRENHEKSVIGVLLVLQLFYRFPPQCGSGVLHLSLKKGEKKQVVVRIKNIWHSGNLFGNRFGRGCSKVYPPKLKLDPGCLHIEH